MSTLDEFAGAKLAELEERRIRRSLRETWRTPGARAERDGHALVSFCCNDYLGLSHHADVKRAAIEATEAFGAGAGASRLVTGNHPLYPDLEARLARVKGQERASVFGSGFLANVGVIPSLVGADDLIVMDALSHASTHAGARLSGARIEAFAHNDADHCRHILREARVGHTRCLVLTEGVFSMDGDRAPLGALAEIAAEHDAWLLVDDAHGFGVLGGGRGASFEADPVPDIPLHMGTLSKAIGAYGGFIAAARPVIELIETRARSLIYSTGLPPSVVASALAALDVIAAEPERVARPLAHARAFTARLGLAEAESQIVPLVVGDAGRALVASAALQDRGYLVTAIRPPTVPDGTARLRVTFSADHTTDDVTGLADAVAEIGIAG
jgi:8-amino-7-oxononanoate synthase